jgi:hypothetical protein
MAASRIQPEDVSPLHRISTVSIDDEIAASATGAVVPILGPPEAIVSGPRNVKRMLHVEWDAAAGKFKVPCILCAIVYVFLRST